MAHVQKPKGGAGGGKAAKGKKAVTGGGKKVEDEREETLQAVVCNFFSVLQFYIGDSTNSVQILADSFETRFSPFTLETPRVSPRFSSWASTVQRYGLEYSS
jgi:translation initiation factor eIF-2B subunit epsilon